jgi:hypothetical protein
MKRRSRLWGAPTSSAIHSVVLYRCLDGSKEVGMRKVDSLYIVESPNDALHDIFFDASVDAGDYHAMIIENYRGMGGFGFVLKRNEIEADDFAVSEFEFHSLAEAVNYLEGQIPYIEVGARRQGYLFHANST